MRLAFEPHQFLISPVPNFLNLILGPAALQAPRQPPPALSSGPSLVLLAVQLGGESPRPLRRDPDEREPAEGDWNLRGEEVGVGNEQ